MFFLVTKNIHSQFAKKLQVAIQEKVKEKVLRTTKTKRRAFYISPNLKDKIVQLVTSTAKGISCPGYYFESDSARTLGDKTIFARTTITGTNGRGIIEFNALDAEHPEAPLYTEYIPKKAEYRVHVFNGEVIDVQQKKKRKGVEGERNTRIRNHNNGYVYCRDGISPPDGITDLGLRAVAALGYQYGAVDDIYNEKRNQCYVLEVNSKPGLYGKTLDCYANAIIKYFNLR